MELFIVALAMFGMLSWFFGVFPSYNLEHDSTEVDESESFRLKEIAVSQVTFEQSELNLAGNRYCCSVILPDHPYYQNHLCIVNIGIDMRGEMDAAGFVCSESAWCDATVGVPNWIFHRGRFYFKKESYATMFLLRWS